MHFIQFLKKNGEITARKHHSIFTNLDAYYYEIYFRKLTRFSPEMLVETALLNKKFINEGNTPVENGWCMTNIYIC